MVKKQQEDLLKTLSSEERKLFAWVREHERRGDWHELKKAVGKPSARLRIVDYVRKLISDDVNRR